MTQSENRTEELGYDPIRGSYRLRHDWTSSRPLSHTIMSMILALSGEEPSSGPPLSESVDPDALDQLFRGKQLGDGPRDHLTFTHDGCTITIYRNGQIVAYPPGDEGETVLQSR